MTGYRLDFSYDHAAALPNKKSSVSGVLVLLPQRSSSETTVFHLAKGDAIKF